MIKIVIAEDHQALIDGIKSFIKYEDDIKFLGSANDGEALLSLVERWKPDVVLCDIRMPKQDGIEATKIISRDFPETKVIAFTMFSQPSAVKKMISAGAYGYISKNSSLEIVVEGIRTVAQGEKYFDGNIQTDLVEGNTSKSILSTREKEILEKIGNGQTSKEIADELFIGKNTVDTHRKNMVKKLNLAGNGELMRYAIEKKYDFD